MPPSDHLPGARLSRRAVLAAAAALAGVAATGCTPDQEQRRGDTQPAPTVPRVDPDVAVAAEALGKQRAMLDLLEETSSRHRRLADVLAPAVAAHEAHAAMLSDAVPETASAAPSATPSATPSEDETSRPRVPRNAARALARVVAAEQQLTTSTKQLAFRAESGAFARLLGSMAAASAQYAASLASASPNGKGSS